MIKVFSQLLGTLALTGFFLTPAFSQSTESVSSEMNMQDHAQGDNIEGMHMPTGDIIVVGDLELSGAFTRAMPPRAVTGGGFVTIINNGTEDDRLVSASSPAAEFVETHLMSVENGVMKMQSQPDGFVIRAGETLELKPGGKHLMFIKTSQRFVEGEQVTVTLNFEHAGSVQLKLPVMALGAMGMEHQSN